MYDIDEIKTSLSLEQIELILVELGGEPIRKGETIISKTICHGGDSHKLYYYDNTHLFHCYTGCDDSSFDIFQLLVKVKHCELPEAVEQLIHFLGLSFQEKDFSKERIEIPDLAVLARWQENNKEKELKNNNSLPLFDSGFLDNFPRPVFTPWEKEGIEKDVCDDRGICFDPVAFGIVIPHRNKEGQVVGIRERTLVKEREVFGKYRPAVFGRKMFNHPLGFNLYNIDKARDAVGIFHKSIIFEGEKSCLKYASFFGMENDISVACCGSSISNAQIELLLESGATEIIIALDKQYNSYDDEDCRKWLKKFCHFDRNAGKAQFSYIMDKDDLLDFKDSPIDKGKEIFLQLFMERRVLLPSFVAALDKEKKL